MGLPFASRPVEVRSHPARAAGGNLCLAWIADWAGGSTAATQEARRGAGGGSGLRGVCHYPDRPQYLPGGRRGVGPAALQLELRPQLKIPLALPSLWLAVPFCPRPILITRTDAQILPGDNSAFYQFVLTQSWLKACRGREGPRDTLSKR